MSNNLNLALRLSYDGKAVTTGARQNVNELNRIPQAVQRQVAANQQLGASQARIMQQQGAMTRQLGLMNTAYGQIGATLTTLVGIGTATMFVRDTGAAQLLDTRLKGLTGSAENYAKVQEYLFATSDRLNTGYTTLADSYSKILTLQEVGVVTQTQGKAILEGMANAAAKTGASNVQLGQSLFGMTQGMTAGVLRAEELNQVTEPMPGLLQKLDKAAGKAAGGFRQMVNDGQVTSQMFKNYLIKALNDYAGAAEATEGKINTSFAEMGNEYQRLIRKYEEPVNFAVTSVVDSITDTMAYLRQNEDAVDNLVFATGALATVLTGHLVAGLSASAAGYVANVAAKNRALIADAALAKQNQANAVLELQRAAQMKAYAQHTLAVANTTNLRTAAVARLAAANTRYTATQAAATTATNIYTAAAGRATLAARGLSTVMGLLGGPVGLLVTAGLGLAYFASQGDDATDSVNKLKEASKDLNPYANLTGSQAQGLLLMAQGRIKNAIQLADEARDRFNNPFLKGRFSDVEAAEKRVTDLKNEIVALQQVLAIKETEKPKPAPVSSSALPDNIKRLEVSLMGEEARLKDSYEKRKQMVIVARENDAANKVKYDAILKQLDVKYGEDLKTIAQKRETEKTRIQNQAEEKRKNDLQRDLENRIATVKGFAGREALAAYNNELSVEQARQQARVDAKRRSSIGVKDEKEELVYNANNQILQLEREKELLAARGFQTQKEADEEAHQERLREIQLRNKREWADENIAQIQGFNSLAEQEDTAHLQRLMGAFADQYAPAMKSQLVALASFEAQTNAEKAKTVVGIGAATFKTMAGQSKTAFKAYKAFAIAQAVINTYQGATAAFTSLAPIPIVGPVLGGVAAAAAVLTGLQQVRQIKAQQPAGIAHGGLDYVPNESTYVLQRGERVLSPKQNTEISQMARRYNAGGAANDAGSGGVSISITNQITVQGSTNEQNSQAVGQDIARQVVGVVVANIQSNGAIIRAVRGAA